MKGLNDIYKPVLASGANLLAIAPLPAPGFVSQNDYKEAQRLALHEAITKASNEWNAAHPEVGSVCCGWLCWRPCVRREVAKRAARGVRPCAARQNPAHPLTHPAFVAPRRAPSSLSPTWAWAAP